MQLTAKIENEPSLRTSYCQTRRKLSYLATDMTRGMLGVPTVKHGGENITCLSGGCFAAMTTSIMLKVDGKNEGQLPHKSSA